MVRYKLLAIILVPLIALTGLTVVQVRRDLAASRRAARVDSLATFAGSVTALVQDLQGERDGSLGLLARGGRPGAEDLAAQRERADRSIAGFHSDLRRIDLAGAEPLLLERLDRAGELLGRIETERAVVNSANPADAATAQRYFGELIGTLLDFDGAIAASSSDPETVRDAATLALLSRLKELSSQERGLVYAALSAGRFDQGQLEGLMAVIGMQEPLAAQFETSARRSQRDLYAAEVQSPNRQRLASLRRAVLEAGAAGPVRVDGPGSAGGISDSLRILTEEVDRLRTVERRLAGDLAASSGAHRSVAARAAFVDGSLTLLAMLVAVAVTLLGARWIAARVAADQAAVRRSIGNVFLNLARRSQDLVGRQLRLIDQLEKDADPDALAQLFKLDHLATRMRRNAESLIVLAGAEPPRRWSQPIPLAEIVRASIGEVQEYQRVELLPIGDVGVSGNAVADLAHLLAELIENATLFSPPGTAVQVTGHEAASGFVVEIEDRGPGMSEEELALANERLSDPPPIESGLERTLGLYVVGRLARRHGIRVQLRHSWCGGVTAMVLLPDGLTTWIRRRELVAPRTVARPAPDPPVPAERAPQAGLTLRARDDAPWFDAPVTAAGSPGRSPEEIRAMLSSYRTGLDRGRRTAAGLREQEPTGRPGDNGGPTVPRSDNEAQ
jgi:signal transduction histidine kinase